MRKARLLAAAAILVGAACEEPTPPGAQPLAPPADGEGIQLGIRVDVPPGTEAWKCLVYDLPRSDDLFFHVNRVHSTQSSGTHHMTISTLAFADVDLPLGLHDCDALYADYPALMEDAVAVYGSQDDDAELSLPTGVVATLPHEIRMLHEIHFVNATEEPVEAWSTVNAYTIPGDDVTGHIWGFAVNDRNLHLPAHKETVEWTRCRMSQAVDMLFLSTHTHALGRVATISTFDEATGATQLLYENTDWHFPPLLSLDPPLHIPAGTVMELRCEFDNTGPSDVEWGFTAADEMCEMIFVFMNAGSDVACDPIASSDGVLDG